MRLDLYMSRKSKVGRKGKRYKLLAGIALLLVFGFLGYHLQGISVPIIERLTGKTQGTQAILVLGGAAVREQFAAQFALQKPNIPIWVSSAGPREYTEWVFDQAGVARDRLHIDFRAVDTLTNFTTLVDDFQARQIREVYLITEESHMPRAKVIGNVVFGSRGIKLNPVTVPSAMKAEVSKKSLRDGLRSLLWLFTGVTPTRPQVN
jgi:uncharacterized SAM-binding protein YcdF (DUF218 family)